MRKYLKYLKIAFALFMIFNLTKTYCQVIDESCSDFSVDFYSLECDVQMIDLANGTFLTSYIYLISDNNADSNGVLAYVNNISGEITYFSGFAWFGWENNFDSIDFTVYNLNDPDCTVHVSGYFSDCHIDVVDYCNDPCAYNYNPVDSPLDGYCLYGPCNEDCSQGQLTEWNFEDCECQPIDDINGCTDEKAVNFNPIANCEDGTCRYNVCDGFNADIVTLCSDDSNEFSVLIIAAGESDEQFNLLDLNTNTNTVIDKSVVLGPFAEGTPISFEISSVENPECAKMLAIDALSCETEAIYKCSDPCAVNYTPTSLEGLDNCIYENCNADCSRGELSEFDTVTCECVTIETIAGCMDPQACNYDAAANCGSITCEYDSCIEACNLSVELTTICSPDRNSYQILMIITGDHTGNGYVITNDLTGEQIEFNEIAFNANEFNDGLGFENGTGYSFTVALKDDESCAHSKSVSMLDCVTTGIELLYFKGENLGQANKLVWATASQSNSKEFLIEKSFDGLNFEKIGVVDAGKNSNTTKTYNYIDDHINSRTNYYRISEIDIFQDKSVISQVLKIENKAEKTFLNVSPNPVQSEINISINAIEFENDVLIEIVDYSGKVVKTFVTDFEQGDNNIASEIGDFNAGIYFVRAIFRNKVEMVKFMKL